MRQRPLGKTGIQVSEVGLGGLFTSSLGRGLHETVLILEKALEAGITFVDTAPAYADSEQVLGEALRQLGPRARQFTVCTKLGGRPRPFNPRDPAGLRASVDESRRLLGREVLDVLLIHEPDRPQLYDWWSDSRACEGPALEVVIRAYGLGGTTIAEMSQCVRSGRFDVLLAAFNYNALFREAADELLPAASGLGMGILIGSVYGQGGMARRFDREVRERPVWLSRPRQQQLLALYALLDECGLSITELSMRFVLGDPRISCALIGPKSAEQLAASAAAAARGPLPADLAARLDQIASRVPFRPFEEPMILPFGKDYRGPGLPNLGAGLRIGAI
jgi:aryl-alcohol dehydrogenase-like predicted oxidoreductase